MSEEDMNRDDITRMAQEAGFYIDPEGEILEGDGWHIQTDIVERFAALVAAAEREECAKVCDKLGDEYADANPSDCAFAIRERSAP
jgi:hypothetical protein